MFYAPISLVNLDSRTLMGVLIWGNLATGLIVCLYRSTNKYEFRPVIRNMAPVRFLSAFGFLCLFLRGAIPDIISANIGNSLLFLCFYIESNMLLKIANLNNERVLLIERIALILSIIVFNIVEYIFHDGSLRIGIASCSIFLLNLPSIVLLLTSKQTNKFKQSAGIFYIPLLIATIPRTFEAFIGRIINIGTNNYYQTLLFGSLVLMMISNTIIYLLFLKENMDSVIEKMANYDNLTDTMNRHNFFTVGKMLFDRYRDQGSGLSVLFFDIDFFKKINDRYGHQFGDDVLIRFANTIKNGIRPTDICCRYGGEEFVVLAHTNEDGCRNIANRILIETEKIAFDAFEDFRMTTSIGCTTGIPKQDETLEMFIKRADQALYQAKAEGRNRAVFYRNAEYVLTHELLLS